MPVSGLPRPLPECRGCKAPMPRAVWRSRRKCQACATPAEMMAAMHTQEQLRRKSADTTRRVNGRIEALAARRASRETAGSR